MSVSRSLPQLFLKSPFNVAVKMGDLYVCDEMKKPVADVSIVTTNRLHN